MKSFYLASVLTVLCANAMVFAQTTSGRISGTVVDASGASIPGAAIQVRNEGTGLSWRAATDERGFYVVPNLPVGEYVVEVEAKGFQRAARKGFALDADSRLTADFALKVGQISEQVVVEDVAGETINTTSAEIGRVIDAGQVDATALNGRNYMQLVTLIPGVAVLDEDQMALTTSMSTASQSVNGNRTNANSITIDGGFNMDAGNNSSQIHNVGVEFVREVKVQTSNFSAEYGRMSGASINVTTRSGGNQYHGALFEYLSNDKVDARSFFAPSVGKLDFNNFGWNAGGPIQRNKLFVFGGQEYKIIRRAAEPVRFSIPTIAQRAGDFSTTSKIYYPGTTTAVPNKNVASLITPDGRAIAKVFDAMQRQATVYNDNVTSSNSTFQGNNPFNSREELVRADYRMSDRNSLYARWIRDTYNLSDPFGGSSDKLPVTATRELRPGSSMQLAYTTVISATRINEAKVNMLWMDDNIVPIGTSWLRKTYGFTFNKYYSGGGGQYPDGIPEIDVNGMSYFKGPAGAARTAFTDLSFADNFTWVRGQHTFKTGVLVTRVRKDQNGKSQYNGLAKINNKGNPNTTNVAFADALLGYFLTYTEAAADPVAFLRFSQAEAYAMDTWKVARRLSLEGGVRYYYMQPAYAQANNLVNFNPGLYDFKKSVKVNTDGTLVPNSGSAYNGLQRAGDGVPQSESGRVPGAASADVLSVPSGAPRGFYSPASLFAPRFGLAWSPFHNDRTTFRTGYGLYYNRPETSLVSPMMNVPPYLQTAQLTNGNLANLTGASAAAPAPIANISAINPNLKNSYTMNFSLSVQRQLPRGVFAELAYVGNLGRHLLRQPDINTPSFANYMLIASYPSASRPSVNAYRPYLGFSQINMRIGDSNSNYNALQAYMTKRKGDLMMTASYTWSKALADSSTNSENPEDPFARRFNYGPTNYDRRQIFVTTFNYSVPVFRGRHGFTGAALAGWELSGVVRAQTGPLLSVTEDGITGVMRADYLGGPANLPPSQRSPDHWFNTAAFVTGPDTRRGTSGMGIIDAPGLYTWDTSLRKTFRVTERFRLRFQADSTNLMNHANFRNLQAKISNKQYGQVTQAGPPRNLQFGLRLQF
jgi:hypothetical protein